MTSPAQLAAQGSTADMPLYATVSWPASGGTADAGLAMVHAGMTRAQAEAVRYCGLYASTQSRTIPRP